ncbi:MAG: response regulator [Anaerolineaceae bacterium]|nr:response regulator [Anaerolineaceae bacterium]
MTDLSASVIIFEPDRLQRDLIVLALRRNQLLPVICDDPSEVRKYLVERKPELLLLDLYLPGQNGLDFIREIQQEGLMGKTRFLFISSIAFPEIIQKAVKMGATDFLVKPLNVELLVSRVQRALSR